MIAGRYRVTDVLFQGELRDGVVGVEVRSGLPVELRRFRRPDRDVSRRLRQVNRALGEVSHPALAPHIDIKEGRADAWLIFEQPYGVDFLTWWSRLPLADSAPFEERWRHCSPLIASILQGLEVLHTRGVGHFDLHPRRLVVTPSGRAVIASVDLPGEMPSSDPSTDYERAAVGYLAPELREGFAVSRAADQFAVGALLYLLITGRKAIAGRSLAEIDKSYNRGKVQTLREWRPDVPAALEDVVLKLLSFEPDDRFPDLTGVRSSLSEFLQPAPQPANVLWSAAPPPTVGRESLDRFFRKRLLEAKAGQGSVIRLMAAAGGGKSTLLEGWERQARDEDVPVWLRSCEPLAPGAVLEGWFDVPDLHDAGSPPPDLIEQALARLGGPAVLLLDTLELLDANAWARIHRVAAAAATGGAPLLGVLSGRALPKLDPRIPTDCTRSFEVGLAPLTPAEIGKLLLPESDDAEDVEVAGSAAESWAQETKGLPGVLFERLLHEQRAGGLKRVGRVWRLELDGTIVSPPTQPPMLPQVLAWLAQLGDYVEVELVMTCLPFERTGLTECLRYGVEEGLMDLRHIAGHWRIVGGGKSASRTTELYGTTTVHGRVARWIEMNRELGGWLAERSASHWRQAGSSENAGNAYERGAQAALKAGITSEARRLRSLAAAFRRR